MNIRIVGSICVLVFVSVSLVLIPSFIGGQSSTSKPVTIKPGDSAADGSILKPYKNAWKVMYAFPGKEPFLVGT